MKKRVVAAIVLMAVVMSFTGCGMYTCAKCDATTSKAYYGTNFSDDWVMCAECARKYWMPFPIENYRVK